MSDEDTTVKQIRDIVGEFVSQRKWGPYHSPKNLAGSICIEAAELLEIFQWEDVETEDAKGNRHLMAKISDEVADVLIYVLSMANSLDLDLTGAIKRKVEANRKKYPA